MKKITIFVMKYITLDILQKILALVHEIENLMTVKYSS